MVGVGLQHYGMTFVSTFGPLLVALIIKTLSRLYLRNHKAVETYLGILAVVCILSRCGLHLTFPSFPFP